MEDNIDDPPLHLAVLAVTDYGSGLEFVRLLIAAGADVNMTAGLFIERFYGGQLRLVAFEALNFLTNP